LCFSGPADRRFPDSGSGRQARDKDSAAVLFALALSLREVQRCADMGQGPLPRRGCAGVLAAVVLIAAAVLVLAPSLVGAWLGGLIGEIWATTIAAIAALLGGLFPTSLV
jgi:hypothetical protein